MDGTSLVAGVEARIERALAEGRLEAGAGLPSERLLAARYGVSRSTVREALLRLEARGILDVRHGRRARVRSPEDLLSFEMVGALVEGEASVRPGRRRLLEGFLEQKRSAVVELLAHASEHASARGLNDVLDACFHLREVSRWEEPPHVVSEAEFALLRAAALAIDSPGRLLLVHSLRKGFGGMSRLLLPVLPIPEIRTWVERAWALLVERAALGIREQLPALLAQVDALLLERVGEPRQQLTAKNVPLPRGAP